MTTEQNDLPHGWAVASLDQVANGISTNGKKVKTKDAAPNGKFPVVDQGAKGCAGYLDDETLLVRATTTQPVVLFGDHTRIVKFIDHDFIPGADGTKLLQAKEEVWPKYLYHLIRAADVPDRGYGRHFHHLKEMALPFAPSTEQRRIADKLDTLLVRVDDVSARLARVAPLLKRFRQSVLAAATSGRLTEDWQTENSAGSCEVSKLLADIQKEKLAWAGTYSAHNEARRVMTRALDFKVRATPPSLPVGWRQAQLEDVVLMVVDCHNKTAPYSANGVPLIRTTNIRFGAFQWDELKYVDDETYVKWSRRCLPEPGDLVFTREAPMGEVAIIPPGARYCLGQRTMLIRPLDQLLSAKYLRLVIMSPAFAAYSGELAVGTGVKHLRVGDVSELRVPVQSRAEQTEIVRRVELLFAFADRLEARLSAAQTATQRLTPALLAKAFRGELVAQDPNDEPAAELLKRLAAQRAAAPTTSTRSRKTTERNVAGDAC